MKEIWKEMWTVGLCGLCAGDTIKKIRKFKMAAIFEEGKFFWKIAKSTFLDTLWVENFDEIALSCTVKEIEANLCFSHLWQKF